MPQRRTVPPHAHPLVQQFFAHLATQHISSVWLAAESGLGQRTFELWYNKTTPTLHNFAAALEAVGLELCIKKKGE